MLLNGEALAISEIALEQHIGNRQHPCALLHIGQDMRTCLQSLCKPWHFKVKDLSSRLR